MSTKNQRLQKGRPATARASGLHGYRAISKALAAHEGPFQSFMRALDDGQVPYLSYSKITSVEFCPYRYYLEYVAGIRLRPEPSYFVKGRTFHKAADGVYRRIARSRKLDVVELEPLIRKHRHEDDQQHLRNAVQLLVQNVMAGWNVLGVEEPFVLSMGSNLPPCIGIVDLVLRKDDTLAVIDHKTGKNFGNTDNLQMAIYRQHALLKYKVDTCLTFFDEYRWVNDLGRIRKPAFQRTTVNLRSTAWSSAVRRFAMGHRLIQQIERTQDAPGTGECYRCPFSDACGKATYTTFSW